MDELDRLFRRLVENIRAGYPEYLSRPFEVAELYQTLIPYRLNRRELGIETNQEYELLLMRLLAGERGYVSADATLQEAMRKELASPNPDTASFRGFTTSRAALAVDAVRRLEPADVAPPDESDSLYAPVPSPAGDASRRFESRSSGPSGVVSRGDIAAPSSLGTATPAFAPRPVPPAPPPRPSAPRAPSPSPRPSAAPMAASPLERAMTSASRPGGHAAHGNPNSCRYCSGSLPEGRDITFCPHCGQNLKIQHCPACSTELEMGWKFCTTCGRNVGAA
jgi:hypothetical protein